MVDTALGPGSVIAGRYRLVEPLGRGGMGTVWRADHLVLGSTVAVKVLHAADDERAAKRFSNEAQAAARLRSPHVVQVLDHGIESVEASSDEVQRVPYIVMELLDGESLGARLATRGALGLAETERIVTQVARALGRAHAAGIVHRDLKPDNIFLVRNDDDEVVKVLDFGIAKVKRWVESPVAAESHTDDGKVVGTPSYMSPEQVQGDPLDARSDLWSLGIVAFQCLSGRLPFQGKTIGDLLTKICTTPAPSISRFVEASPEVDAWMERALERRPEDRFDSAKDMADALRLALGLTVAERAAPPPATRIPASIDAMLATTAEAPRNETASDGSSVGVTRVRAATGRPFRTLAIGAAVLAIAVAALWVVRDPAGAPSEPTSTNGREITPRDESAALHPASAPMPLAVASPGQGAALPAPSTSVAPPSPATSARARAPTERRAPAPASAAPQASSAPAPAASSAPAKRSPADDPLSF